VAPLGWVSCIAKDGSDNLLPLTDPAAAAFAAAAAASGGGSGRGGGLSTRTPGRQSPGREGKGPDSTVYVVRKDLKMRDAVELNSVEAGTAAGGTEVRILDRKTLPDGTRRACIGSNEADPAPLGWVSMQGKDGSENLLAQLMQPRLRRN
jgi:hypothetical protein